MDKRQSAQMQLTKDERIIAFKNQVINKKQLVMGLIGGFGCMFLGAVLGSNDQTAFAVILMIIGAFSAISGVCGYALSKHGYMCLTNKRVFGCSAIGFSLKYPGVALNKVAHSTFDNLGSIYLRDKDNNTLAVFFAVDSFSSIYEDLKGECEKVHSREEVKK